MNTSINITVEQTQGVKYMRNEGRTLTKYATKSRMDIKLSEFLSSDCSSIRFLWILSDYNLTETSVISPYRSFFVIVAAKNP